MSLKGFTIQFNKPGAIYVPGENITGTVIIDLSEKKNCRDFRIAFKGEAYVHWTESHAQNSTGNIVFKTKSEKERFFDFQQPLIHKPPGTEGLELPAGRSEYHFTYRLPTNIPCSFEHDIGYIRYTVRAVVNIPWGFDWWAKSAFTIVTPFDLNSVADQCIPVDDEDIKKYCCCFFGEDSIYARVKIPCTGYVPGQTIDVDVSFVVKSSRVHVTGVSAKLEEEITFYVRNEKRMDKITLQKVQTSEPLETREQIRLQVYVPPVPPSYLLFCRIIHVEYHIIVNIHVNGLYKKITRQYPILIGTIPLHSSMWPQQSNNEGIQSSTLVDSNGDKVPLCRSNLPSPKCSAPPIEWPMPSPSYKECSQKTNDIKDTDDSGNVFGADQPFAPRYPVFNFGVSSAPKQ
ncbi:hypothetical protein KPH14_011032 [Odynerus spinipes]|uniref:Arrestin C-terminal-like domain-containing protein n=1 Tax=Odynerus spinipes TaxID=1348599 RepID=A0AAD9RI42_9HYME|nr:hypothetical protein KPH14_011032 [Odynerus spinipes]